MIIAFEIARADSAAQKTARHRMRRVAAQPDLPVLHLYQQRTGIRAIERADGMAVSGIGYSSRLLKNGKWDCRSTHEPG